MRKSVQRAAVKDVVSVEWSLRILRISLSHPERFLATLQNVSGILRIRSQPTAANCVSTDLNYKTKCYVITLLLQAEKFFIAINIF